MRHCLFSLGLSIVLATTPVVAEDVTPQQVIESAVEMLAESLEGRRQELTADREALYTLIDEVLLPRFDRKFAAQIVLAKHWRTADPHQRDRFVEAFYQALVRRYAEGLLEFEPDQVTVLPFRGDLSKKRTKVRTTVRLSDGTKVAVDYELVKRDSGWLLFNIVIEGISYVRNFRSEMNSEIVDSSLDAVIERLEGEAGIVNDG